jgi:hypothetical protein
MQYVVRMLRAAARVDSLRLFDKADRSAAESQTNEVDLFSIEMPELCIASLWIEIVAESDFGEGFNKLNHSLTSDTESSVSDILTSEYSTHINHNTENFTPTSTAEHIGETSFEVKNPKEEVENPKTVPRPDPKAVENQFLAVRDLVSVKQSGKERFEFSVPGLTTEDGIHDTPEISKNIAHAESGTHSSSGKADVSPVQKAFSFLGPSRELDIAARNETTDKVNRHQAASQVDAHVEPATRSSSGRSDTNHESLPENVKVDPVTPTVIDPVRSATENKATSFLIKSLALVKGLRRRIGKNRTRLFTLLAGSDTASQGTTSNALASIEDDTRSSSTPNENIQEAATSGRDSYGTLQDSSSS